MATSTAEQLQPQPELPSPPSEHEHKAPLDKHPDGSPMTQDEIDRGMRYLKRVAASETIDISYREQIAAILDRYELRKISDKEAARRQSLVEWVDKKMGA